jgi:uncharacterized membrane protein YgcG
VNFISFLSKTATFVFCLITLFPQNTIAKSIRYEVIDVEAKLNKEGHLDVIEKQRMYFNGAWNGGYREFKTMGKQKVIVHGISRTTTVGLVEPLKRGSVHRKYHYQFTNNKLKWRNRLPSDPPFDNIFRQYIIKYTILNVIQHNKKQLFLNHDFLFERTSPVKFVNVTLEIDPFWISEQSTYKFHDENVPGNKAFRKKVIVGDKSQKKFQKFFFNNAGPTDPLGPIGISICLLVFFGFLIFRYKKLFQHEEENGRFEPLTPTSQIDESWIEKHVLSFKPEVAAALWDEQTSSDELTALMISFHQRGYIKISFEEAGFWMFKHQAFILEKLKPFDDLEKYEKQILAGLFFDDRERVTQQQVRSHHRNSITGYIPVAILSYGIQEEIRKIDNLEDKVVNDMSVLSAVGLAFLALFGFISIFLFDTNFRFLDIVILAGIFSVGTTAFCATLSWYQARQLINAKNNFWIHAIYAGLPFIIHSAVFYSGTIPMGVGHWLFTLFTGMFMADLICLAGTNRNSKVKLDVRQDLNSAYLYFKEELKKKEPNLKDEWLPYLMGFGLAKHVGRWDQSYGRNYHVTSGTGMMANTSSTSAWTGGGGDFSGAGASGSWATSLGSIGTSTSTSSGGSGGSGGSSGGGGGGGW